MRLFSVYFTPEAFVTTIVVVIAVLIVLFLISRRLRRRVKPKKFREKWSKLQKKLPDQKNWLDALAEADKMLDDALKKNNVKGASMGERLVNAQKDFKDKDEVWFGHKLRKKHQENPSLKLKKTDVKRALLALRQALKDLGAI